ncbi:BON domain-containing protein OS=Streptomyces alboniger OX=132473 GN=CP975_28795 PE=4 SV=1 [Streptomyces alboniger]
MNEPANVEYRIAHLHERLAAEGHGELGVRVEHRGSSVTVAGTVPTAQCREELLRAVHEELDGLTVHCDIVVAEAAAPDHVEEIS